MTIARPPTAAPAAPAAPPRPAARAGSSFRVAWGGAPSPAPAAAGLAGVGTGLLALQAEEDDTARDETARRRAGAALEELLALQADLLRGRVAPDRLRRLAALSEGEGAADPGLREACAAVSLRARVELARIERHRAGRAAAESSRG